MPKAIPLSMDLLFLHEIHTTQDLANNKFYCEKSSILNCWQRWLASQKYVLKPLLVIKRANISLPFKNRFIVYNNKDYKFTETFIAPH